MKLSGVHSGKGIPTKLKLLAMGAAMGGRAPDILRVLMYRPEFFGKPFNVYTQELLRGPSEWTVGERELFAAFVSQVNECAFCAGAHGGVASKMMGADVVQQALANVDTAPVSDSVKASLHFLRKLTKDPAQVRSTDVQAIRATGVSDDGIQTVIHICFLFCLINRVADSLGFEVPSTTAFARIANVLIKHGYAS
jgi:uncharacterized peroxidase-related enzyme